MVFGPILSVVTASNAQRKQKAAHKRTREILDDQSRQMINPPNPVWFDPNRSDFWNNPNRWDGIDDPHTEVFWTNRRVDRIDCSAPKRAEPHPWAQSDQSPYAGMGGLQHLYAALGGPTGAFVKAYMDQKYGMFR